MEITVSGVVNIARLIHYLEKAFALDGAVGNAVGIGKTGLCHYLTDGVELRAVTYLVSVAAAACGVSACGVGFILIENILEGNGACLITCGVYVGNVVTDNVHSLVVNLKTRHTGVK